MSNRKSNQLSCWQPSAANTRWLVAINKEYIIIWYNFQACCIAGYRNITPGSELSDHPSYRSVILFDTGTGNTYKETSIKSFVIKRSGAQETLINDFCHNYHFHKVIQLM